MSTNITRNLNQVPQIDFRHTIKKPYIKTGYTPYKLVLMLKERLTGSKEESKITLDIDESSNNNLKKIYTISIQKGKPNIKTIC